MTGMIIPRVALGKNVSWLSSSFNRFSMVFSRAAARHLAESCSCPSIDSPDDMIIGMFLSNVKKFKNF